MCDIMTRFSLSEMGAPPQLLILLWHHTIYHKRHWIGTLFLLLKPFGMYGIMYYVSTLAVGENFSGYGYYTACNHSTSSAVTDGPLAYLWDMMIYEQPSTCHAPPHPTTQPRGRNYHQINRCLDSHVCVGDRYRMWEDPPLPDPLNMDLKRHPEHCTPYDSNNMTQGLSFKPDIVDFLCAVQNQTILYYPKTNLGAVKIMTRVERILGEYLQFGRIGAAAMGKTDPKFNIETDSMLSYEPREHVRGFDTFVDLQKYTREESKRAGVPYLPHVWGVVALTDMDTDPASTKHSYTLLYDHVEVLNMWHRNYPHKFPPESVWLQELVERAVVEEISGRDVDIGLALKPIATKCWLKPQNLHYTVFQQLFLLCSIFAFLSSPATFVTQVILEKELKLREYLYIMGVHSTMLTFSWILFYSLLLVPLTVAFVTLVLITVATDYIAESALSLVYVLLIGYNINMLCFCYMLSSLFQSSRTTAQTVHFLTIVIWLLSAVQFGVGMSPPTVTLCRLVSFHPVVPLAMGYAYIIGWEKHWVGATTSNLFLSPWLHDTYGGVGEALCWMFLSVFLYLFLGWYFEKIFPGEFGQAQPFYFIFTPKYWISHKNAIPNIAAPDADVELVEGKEPGIVLDQLTKIYQKNKIVLNQLSLIFYKNEITAFLGENGAGKSTAMNILVGLINPTSGNALVHGLDIRTQMDEIRQMLGFVPQYDILYPSFTVREHLQFFGWLRGMSKSTILDVTDDLLQKMGMEGMDKIKTTDLSGGQKRKLSIITGYLGSPQAIIFDEPTSGVDPMSRRSIWETILSRKLTTTTVLSTHFMDEADLLGDRVAIISEGELKCSGSPMYLKNKYGKGYHLIIARTPQQSDKEAIIQFISEQLPQCALFLERGLDMDFELTKEVADSERMIDVLRAIDHHQIRLGILSYGLSEPTLERVFFNSIKTADTDVQADASMNEPEATSDQIVYEPSKRWGTMACALFKKRALNTIYSKPILATQILLPLVFVALIGLTVMGDNAFRETVTIHDPSRTNIFYTLEDHDNGIDLKKFIDVTLFRGSDKLPDEGKGSSSIHYDQCLKECRTHCKMTHQPNTYAKLEDGIVYRLLAPPNVNITRWITHINKTDRNVVGGFEFRESSNATRMLKEYISKEYNDTNMTRILNETRDQFVVLAYEPRLIKAMINLWNNMLLRWYGVKSGKIELVLDSAQLIDVRTTDPDVGGLSRVWNEVFSPFWLIFALTFSNFGVLISIQYEVSTGLKRLQMLYGANPFVYWTMTFAFDMITHCVSVLVIVAALAAISERWREGGILPVLAIGIPFGYQSITFFYLLTFCCSKDCNIIGMTISMTVFAAVAAFPLAFMDVISLLQTCALKDCAPVTVQNALSANCTSNLGFVPRLNVLSGMVPSFQISSALHIINFVTTFTSVSKISQLDNCIYTYPILGKRMLMCFVWGTLYLIGVCVMEYYDWRFHCDIRHCFKKGRTKPIDSGFVDADVKAEVDRVFSGKNSEDVLVVRQLTKYFRKLSRPAVNGITFGVEKSQTFGLLGINGAGKTTTFSMLTGFLRPSYGIAGILGKNLFSRNWARFKNSSYCPQDNTLFRTLTIEAHLKLVAQLRGVPQGVIKELSDRLIHEVGLDSHRGKSAGQLSGGNQRKLQFAMALVDYRPVIFLDEPTTGMDPGARRMAWACVARAVKKGCSVVLSSHSMEECEAMCHKLVIMVAGSFTCLGSIQYLKHKFADKYVLKVKLQSHAAGDAPRLKSVIQNLLPTSTLQDEHGAMICFEIPCSEELKLFTVLEVIMLCRSQFAIEDVSVCQTTLEQVFINMARVQSEIDSGESQVKTSPVAPSNPSATLPPPEPQQAKSYTAYRKVNENDMVTPASTGTDDTTNLTDPEDSKTDVQGNKGLESGSREITTEGTKEIITE